MKNIFAYLVILFVAITLWGCPYKSPVPLAEATESVNKQVLGDWMSRHEGSKENPEYYNIEMRDTLHYDIRHFQYNENEDGYALKEYVGWTTRIDNINFMNIQESGQTDILLFRLDVMGDELMMLYEVTGNIDERFEKSEDLYAFAKKHMGLSFFYNTDEVELIKRKKE